MKSLTGIITLLFALATQSSAHEFWLEPKKFQANAGESVEIDLRNGEDFEGIELSWFDPRIDRAVVIRNGKVETYQGAPGDLPGMTVTAGAGLTVVAYASKLSRLTYSGWDKTLSFAAHKDMPWFAARHAERGLPQEGVTEGYWRFSKTLINGAGPGSDVDTGMETEFVLLDPVTAGPELRARLLYQGKPRPDAQVELWEKQGEEVIRTLHRTGPDGIVTLPVRPGHAYMIDAVVLREPASDAAREAGVMWESLWANLTFAVPE
jgi:uncharacterized GH25 family protein